MRFPCLSESFNACRTGYSVPRIPLRRFDVLEVFRRASSPLSSESGSSSPRLRTLFRDPNQVPPCFLRRKTVVGYCWAPPLRFFAPTAVVDSANRLLSGSTRTPFLFDLSQVLEALILAEPCRLVSSCCRSWGSLTFRAFPCRRTLSGSSPDDPLSAFPPSTNGRWPRPQGFS